MQAGKRSAWDSGHWHPDLRASLSLAAAATLLVMAGFAALFSTVAPFKLSQTSPSVREVLVLAEPTPRVPRPIPRARIPRAVLPVQLPELQRLPPLPQATVTGRDSFSLQDYLDERAKAGAVALKDQVTASDLKRNLGKSTEQQALRDDQGFRGVGGQKIVRSGGSCAQIQTVQGSPSPTNHVDIAEPTSCPGESPDASQEMSKSLDDWAKKARQSQSSPPSPR